jgi:hypothetical protein
MTKASTKNRFLIGGVVAAALALASAGAATSASAGTLDQEQAVYGGLGHSIYADDTDPFSESSVAQTFTAGITGQLDQVELYVGKSGSPTADLTVQIYDTFDGTPQSALATESVPAAAVSAGPTFVPVTFDPTVPVTAGTQYAIVAWTASLFANPYFWGEAGGNPYAAGELRVQQGSNASPPTPGFWGPSGATVDMTFRTYVIPPPTQPPAQPPVASPTGKRAAALKKCKKKKSKKARKKCRKKARRLPV